jgi:predicted nucleic acid-binding protein
LRPGSLRFVRIYLNTSALNRPFDDLGAERVRREAEAVLGLIEAIEQGKAAMIASEYLEFEVDQDPDRERVEKVRTYLDLAAEVVPTSTSVADRARSLERRGLRGLDALHLASAEASQSDLLVTTDDRFLRRGGTIGTVRVVSPSVALAEIEREDASR